MVSCRTNYLSFVDFFSFRLLLDPLMSSAPSAMLVTMSSQSSIPGIPEMYSVDFTRVLYQCMFVAFLMAICKTDITKREGGLQIFQNVNM